MRTKTEIKTILTLHELSKITGLKEVSLRLYLCRPDFNKYKLRTNPIIVNASESFWRLFIDFLKLKVRRKGVEHKHIDNSKLWLEKLVKIQ